MNNSAPARPDTASLLPGIRTLAASAPRPRPTAAVLFRNIEAARHSSYLWVLLSGLFEPAFYLGSVGVGVGALVGHIIVGGHSVRYAAFVAPAMLASSLMNSAFGESVFTFFARYHLMRLHDVTACTPVSSAEIMSGEALWSVLKGAMLALPFTVLLCAVNLLDVSRAPALFLGTFLVSAAFSSLGLALAVHLRGTQGFDRVNLFAFAMFVFSGTFVPTSDYPTAIGVLAQCTPLAQAVGLTRDLSADTVGWATAGHCAYLTGLSIACLAIASRRVERTLRA
jgi:lipooligosaccharide transport system permease protein